MKALEAAVLALIVLGLGFGYGAYKYGHHQGFAQGYTSGYSNGQKLATQADSLLQAFNTQTQLNACLDKVDSAVSKVSTGLTLAQENTLLDEQKQAVQECQLRYPTH